MIKKIFAVLPVCLLLAALTVHAFAAEAPEEAFEYTVNDGGVTINKYIGSDTEVIIPAEIEGKPVTEIGWAFENCTSVTSIEIPDSVIYIGHFAFRHCEALTSVKIPDSVASIGNLAFADCTSLTSITLPSGLDSINNLTFCKCTSLTSIEIPESVTFIDGHAFLECSSLTSLTIPDSVEYVGMCAFAECRSLETIMIPDGLDIPEDAIPSAATQVRYKRTEKGMVITETTYRGGHREIPAEICGIPVISFGEDISSHAGIYEESEEI